MEITFIRGISVTKFDKGFLGFFKMGRVTDSFSDTFVFFVTDISPALMCKWVLRKIRKHKIIQNFIANIEPKNTVFCNKWDRSNELE